MNGFTQTPQIHDGMWSVHAEAHCATCAYLWSCIAFSGLPTRNFESHGMRLRDFMIEFLYLCSSYMYLTTDIG